jgi:hypothetical protein
MAFSIYIKNGALQTVVDKVFSCDTYITLKGVKTLAFETLLTDELLSKLNHTDLVVEYAGDYYDVVSVARSLSRGLYKVQFNCEHISYRLNEYTNSTFIETGTPREILTKLLEGTEFQVGIVDSTEISTFEVNQDATVRSLILKLADKLKMDISFDFYSVSLFRHKGRIEPVDIIDDNVVSISKTVKASKESPVYAITIKKTKDIIVGDELHLKFTKLGIDENVRLIGIRSKPFTSKNLDLEVGDSEASLEADLVQSREEAVNKNTSYYGVKVSEISGLTIERGDNAAKVIMNADEFRMQALDSGGELEDKLYFDPETGNYKFKGSIEVKGGMININDKFIVDEHGNAYLSGDSTIYGGKYYAGLPGSDDGFSQMTLNGFEVYNSDGDLKLRLGYTTEDEDFPFLQLGSGSGEAKDFGLVKKFSDGLWIGNSIPADDQGTFTAMEGYNGIFFKFSDNTAYVVKDTDMKNIYTGAAIAKFG